MDERSFVNIKDLGYTGGWTLRKRALTGVVAAVALLMVLIISGLFIGPDQLGINFQLKNAAPSLSHPFGTDWLGREMFLRKVKGLTLNFGVGILAAFISVVIAFALSNLAAFNKILNAWVTWVMDLFIVGP